MLTVEAIKTEIMRRREELKRQIVAAESASFARSLLQSEGNALGELLIWILNDGKAPL